MDARIIFLLVAAVAISGFFFGRDMHDWNGPPTRAAADRVVLKIGERAAPNRIDQAVDTFEDADPPQNDASGGSE